MRTDEKLLQQGYSYAKEVYAANGVDVEAAIAKLAGIPISMNCWQGDDIMGFESTGGASGGIATTGNYPGRATTPEQLRADIDFAMALIPGVKKLNLHANYAELNGRKVERSEYTADLFANWIAWAKEKNVGLDFNPTYFSHPLAADGFTLSSEKKSTRDFWIEHGKRCREIGSEFAKATGKECLINFWMPDGFKDSPADTSGARARLVSALDEIFAQGDMPGVKDAVESKLFGIGVESFTVGSHELMYGYALTRGKLYCLDAGHYHPTEVISNKISAIMQYMPEALLHVSRPVRWDSDHVVTMDDELLAIMQQIVRNDYTDRVKIALDFFDASINRVAAWVIGTRNSQKALLRAMLENTPVLKAMEHEGDYTGRLARMEEDKMMPFSAVWDYYCALQDVPSGSEWIETVRKYERDVMFKR